MNITYVTALYNIYKAKDGTETIKRLLDDVKVLLERLSDTQATANLSVSNHRTADTQANLIIFADDFFIPLLSQWKNNAIIIHLPIDQLKIYNHILSEKPDLPPNRNETKDTIEYIALMNTKIEFLVFARQYLLQNGKKDTKYLAWIDAGVNELFRNKEKTYKQMTRLKINSPHILMPGAYKMMPSFAQLHQQVYWVFLGTFFICPIDYTQIFYQLSLQSLNKFLTMKKITWEVNIWIDIFQSYNIFHWYEANHDDRLISNIPLEVIGSLESSNTLEDELNAMKQMVTKYRFSHNWQACYDLAHQVLQKEKNNPFSGVYEDLSIVCYYMNKKEEGRIAIEKILAHTNNGIKTQALQNLEFYIQPLKMKSIKDITLQNLNWPERIIDLNNTFSSTPCLVQQGDHYLCNIRVVNYRIMNNGAYDIKDPEGKLRTRNILLKLDKALNVIEQKELDTNLKCLQPRYPGNILGLEDMRMLQNNENTYFFATCCETLPYVCPRIVFGCFKDHKFEFIKKIDISEKPGNTPEKNWLPFNLSENELQFIYSYDPLHIYKISLDGFQIKLVKRTQHPLLHDYDVRGSASPIPFEYRGEKGWLFTIHQVSHNHPRKYYHRFLWYNNDFEKRYQGPLFYFEKIGIEYNLSICPSLTNQEEYLLTYSINDGCSKICIVDKQTIVEHLNFTDTQLLK